mmetsp:Transcript_19165/g.39469  ORF Transcript_19165/g.39469 Transcript_19165/m.39469 type:complete len:218 (-) Transcript_19165:2154-2807(-)
MCVRRCILPPSRFLNQFLPSPQASKGRRVRLCWAARRRWKAGAQRRGRREAKQTPSPPTQPAPFAASRQNRRSHLCLAAATVPPPLMQQECLGREFWSARCHRLLSPAPTRALYDLTARPQPVQRPCRTQHELWPSSPPPPHTRLSARSSQRQRRPRPRQESARTSGECQTKPLPPHLLLQLSTQPAGAEADQETCRRLLRWGEEGCGRTQSWKNCG